MAIVRHLVPPLGDGAGFVALGSQRRQYHAEMLSFGPLAIQE